MVTCMHCGHDNPENTVLCTHCGLPVESDLIDPSLQSREGATRRLDSMSQSSAFPRWGTARLGTERKLLLHIRGHDTPLLIELIESMILGRYDTDTGETPDIDLEEYGAQDMGVSRRHAAVLIEDDAVKIMDLSSANATYINGQKLIPRQARILRDGDELRLGRMVIRVNFV